MAWLGIYIGIAVMTAAVAFVAAGWIRDSKVAAPDNPGLLALLAGLLWPVVLVGAVQLLILAMARAAVRSASRGNTRASRRATNAARKTLSG